MFEKIIKIIFPQKCGFCNMLIKKDYTCKKCKKKLEYICIKKNLQKIDNKYFDFLISSYIYSGILRDKILKFKFNNKKYLYKSLSEELVRGLKKYADLFDCIVYVPTSLNRYFERGYNQSKLIAKFIANELNKPLVTFTLFKRKDNKKQSELNANDRISNVENVYKVLNENVIYGRNVLLVDDIYTTGATVNECSKVLKLSGAKSIIVATIARAQI